MKRFATIILTAALASSAFAATSYNLNAGLQINESSTKSTSFDPALNLNGYFAGQLNFGKYFSLRGEFSFQTENMIDSDLIEDVEGNFSVNELSLNFIKPFAGITHSVSAFAGTFEPVGSGHFLQRQFAVRPFGSKLTESWFGVKGGNIFSFYGYGGAYTMRYSTLPLSTGIIIFKNDKNLSNNDQLVCDLRVGMAFRYFSLDASAGTGLYISNKDNNGKKVICYIDSVYSNFAVDMLIGNRDLLSVLVQCGLDAYPIKQGDKLEEDEKIHYTAKDLYLLVEPRFNYKNVKLSTTVYNIPEEKRQKMFLIDNQTGISQTIEVNKLNISGTEIAFGAIGMLSFRGKDIMDLDKLVNLHGGRLIRDYGSWKVCPYVNANFAKGELNATCQVNISKLRSSDADSIKVNLGYRMKF